MGEVFLGASAGERLGANRSRSRCCTTNIQQQPELISTASTAKPKATPLLNHPNIVSSLNVGQVVATGKYYLILEYVDGFSSHAHWLNR